MGLIAFIPLLLIFYFMLIRPQQKRVKEHAQLIAALESGDVLLTSGIYGTITQIDREMLEVEVADGVALRVARNAVSEIVEYDTDEDAADGDLTDVDALGDEA